MSYDGPLTIESSDGAASGVRILRLTGPVSLRNAHELQARLTSGPEPRLTILDFTHVPYIDSTGLGTLINSFAHCRRAGTRMILAGVKSRVLELFKMMKVDTVIPMVATIEEAESGL